MIKPINYALNHTNPPMFPSMISIIQQNPWDFPWDFPMFHGIFPGVPWIFPGFPWIFPWISPVVHCPTFHRWIWRRSSSSCPRRRPAWHWRSSRWPAAAAAKDADPEPVGAVKKKMGHPRTAWWWLEPWNFITFYILGISSSQLTLTPSFFRGVGGSTTNQS